MPDEFEPAEGELQFVFQQSPHYTEVLCDGGFGGPTPTGDRIFLAVYSERLSQPDAVTHRVGPTGGLGEEIVQKRKDAGGVVRFVHFGLYLEAHTARQLAKWLLDRAQETDAITAARNPAGGGDGG